MAVAAIRNGQINRILQDTDVRTFYNGSGWHNMGTTLNLNSLKSSKQAYA